MGKRTKQAKARLQNLARANMKRQNPDKDIQEIRAEIPYGSTFSSNQTYVMHSPIFMDYPIL